MAVTITQQNGASNDLLGYFDSWSNNYSYDDNGFFNPDYNSGGPYTQWGAGDIYDPANPAATPTPSVILGGQNFEYNPGEFSGDIQSLNFGEGIYYDSASSEYVQNDQLLIDVSSVDVSTSNTFSYAIYVLSNFGSFTSQTVFGTNFPGMYDFFAEQGTEQIGTASADTQSSFGGNDSLTGGSGNDAFRFVLDDTGASAIGEDTITDFDAANETIYIGLNDSAYDSYSEIRNAASDTAEGVNINLGSHGSITLEGVTVSELSSDNFDFV
ncbi:hypothetical protein [uncultured Martelella sp.]|uniref:hypothetical protein n=1 Tax=uncultured Martelella sp. TaxID=392331 RepID=UPI0029C7B17D|nr:hypothetical protein [uncultured Martelella sp.]